jgi:serine protease Do
LADLGPALYDGMSREVSPLLEEGESPVMRPSVSLMPIAVLAAWAWGGPPVQAQQPSGLATAAALEQALVEAIAGAEKSVVAIARVHKERTDNTFRLEDRPDPFGRRIGPPQAPKPGDPDFVPSDFAAGVVIDARGLILTAYHVLADESDYYVTAQDRKVYRAWVKAADPRSDLAVLAIEATDLTPIRLGNAAAVKKGQIVIALGNPYAIARDGQPSASWGIVANLARKAPPQPDETDPLGKSTLHHFGTLIQTDAKLNLGTSGGALVNLRGEMIGLCTSLAATVGYETAAGYAFPVDETFRRVVETLKQGREAEYGYLGIRRPNYVPEGVVAGQPGVRIHDVVAGTPAHRFGLRPGDVVTAVNGVPIYDFDGLVLEVGKLPVEAVARLRVLREGRPLDLDVGLTKYPVRGTKIVTTRPDPWRGMQVDYPTSVVDSSGRPLHGSAAFDGGVAVVEVQEGTAAWKAGLRPGMLVSHIGRTAIHSPKEFREAVAGRSDAVRLRVADDPENPERTVAPGS